MVFNGEHLYNSIFSGAAEVIKNKNILNKINVFPVADGDTGSNLSTTMTAMIENMKNTSDFSMVLKSAAESALIGARGNSGIIFAQFFYGFYLESSNQSELTIGSFVAIMKRNVHRLYDVVTNPMEGTILTVINQWVIALEKYMSDFTNLHSYLEKTLNDTNTALENTTRQLPILEKHNVVDSGAKAFCLFIKGAAEYLLTGITQNFTTKTHIESFAENKIVHESGYASNYRFCCEGILRGQDLQIKAVSASLKDYGDSLIVAGGGELVKVHIHANSPEILFAQMLKIGDLSNIKADDMHLQANIVSGTKAKTAIVTDSIADLTDEFCFNNHIFVLPMQIEIDGAMHLDRISMSSDTFYKVNKNIKEHPKTSLPNIKNTENLFRYLAQYYDNILVLSVSDKLSGSNNMLKGLAKSLADSNIKITVVNTLTNSGAQGLLVKQAVELAQQGRVVEEIEQEILHTIPKTKILVAVSTVKYLERSGRVSRTVSNIAKILGLKPFMTIDKDGYGKAYGGTFSHKFLMKKIENAVRKEHKTVGIKSFCVVHANAYEKATMLSESISNIVGTPVQYISSISPAVGATAGEGTVAVAYTTY